MPMDAEREQQVMELLEAALQQAPGGRSDRPHQ